MEIEFKKIGLEDRALIDRYLSQKTYRSCEFPKHLPVEPEIPDRFCCCGGYAGLSGNFG